MLNSLKIKACFWSYCLIDKVPFLLQCGSECLTFHASIIRGHHFIISFISKYLLVTERGMPYPLSCIFSLPSLMKYNFIRRKGKKKVLCSISKWYLNREIHLWPPCGPIDVIPIYWWRKHFVVLLHKESLKITEQMQPYDG